MATPYIERSTLRALIQQRFWLGALGQWILGSYGRTGHQWQNLEHLKSLRVQLFVHLAIMIMTTWLI